MPAVCEISVGMLFCRSLLRIFRTGSVVKYAVGAFGSSVWSFGRVPQL